MNKQKAKISLVVFTFLVVIIVLLFVVSNKNNPNVNFYNKDKNNVVEENFNPNKYKDVQSYLKTIKVNGVNLENDNFIIYSGSIVSVIEHSKFDLYNTDREILNTLLVDINSNYKNNTIYKSNPGKGESGVKILNDTDLPPFIRFSNDLLTPYDGESFNQIKKDLESKKNRTFIENKELIYLYSFEGNYKKSNDLRLSLCSTSKDLCKKSVNFTFSGKVIDDKGNPVNGAIVFLLNDKSINTKTDINGNYTINFNTYPQERLRIKAYSQELSDGYYVSSIVLDGEYSLNANANFTLQTPQKIIELSPDIDGKEEFYYFSTTQTDYKVPVNSIVYEDGKPYNGKIKVYLYEFNKLTNMDNYMNNDTFDSVYGYVGNIMKTFGMKYLQIFTPEGEELHIDKSNPAFVTQRIYHMKELYENYDKIYSAVTDEDMEFLVDSTKKICGDKVDCYPIDRKWLIDNNMLRWPASWVLDRTKGTWENLGVKVIDKKGVIEAIYYTINLKGL
ncbi:MAG: carboxypeptidase-like regulatory domain-containing protein [Candidatus Gracilibacteria bacterium]|nr:carboxypeptidase-like regulatory domain-containing protein [Candidatus Gracilibacteria bacterium]